MDRALCRSGGGADVILIPEIPFDLEKVATSIRGRDAYGARFSIVVVAEGAMRSADRCHS
jgi:6-phosphofructokinase 1